MMVFRLFVAALVLVSGPAFAAGNFQRLYSDQAEASSFLQSDWNKYSENYHPNYALDDDPKTAWVEGAPGNGEGETLTIGFSLLSSARTVRVRIRNGYQRSKELLAANAAPRDVTLSLLNAAGEEVFQQKASLTKSLDWQQVDLSPPAHAQLAFLKVRIDSTWPGSRYKDTCISDVQLLVDSDVPYNAKAELAKKAALTAWIKDRWETARYFATLPKTYPFAATHYDARAEFELSEPSRTRAGVKVAGFVPLDQQVQKGVYPAAWKKLFDDAQTERIQRLMKLAKERGASLGKTWYTSAVKSRIHVPDGLPGQRFGEPLLDRVADFFERSNFAIFEATQASTRASSTEDGGWRAETSQLRVELTDSPTPGSGAPGENAPVHVKRGPRIHALYFWQHAIIEGRMNDFEDTQHVLLMCDEQERPSELLILSDSNEGWSVTAFSFALDSKGRVEKVTLREAAFRWDPEADPDQGINGSNDFELMTFSPTAHG